MSDADKKVLARANRAVVSKEDILEFVEELSEHEASDRDFEGRAILLAQLHSGEPDKALAIEFRMHALARLFGDEHPRGWTLPEMPDGSVLTKEPVFAAAAVQPLTLKDGEVAFERDAFLDKVLELADEEGAA
jgi:hypothetical protein